MRFIFLTRSFCGHTQRERLTCAEVWCERTLPTADLRESRAEVAAGLGFADNLASSHAAQAPQFHPGTAMLNMRKE